MTQQQQKLRMNGLLVNTSIVVMLASLFASNVFAKDIPGATQTSYGVSNSGAFQFQVPIVTPEGRNDVQPNIALSFSSNAGAGSLGIGWVVSGLSAITRCGKNLRTDGVQGGVQHSTNDRYCLNGQRLILVSGTQGAANSEYRTELDNFSKIVAYGNGSINVNGGRAPTRWRVWTKNGQIIDYGAPGGSNSHTAQFKLPGTDSIHSWNVSRVSDRDGNYYEATYRSGDGLIDKIEYLFAGGSAKNEVDFIYEANTGDTRFRYVLGSRIDFQDRLKSVEVRKNNQVFRSYAMQYENAPMSGRSRIVAVKECGRGGACMPDIEFDWQASLPGYVSGNNSSSEHNIAPDDLIEYYDYARHIGDGTTENSVKEINRGEWADVNGDGEVDLVIAYMAPNGTDVRKTYIRENKKWVQKTAWKLPRPLRGYQNSIVNTPQARFLPDSIDMGQLVDVNGDGLLDIVYSYRFDTNFRQYGLAEDVEDVRETWINTGSTWQKQNAWAPKDILFDYLVNSGGGHTRTATNRGSLVDLNGDGLVDWVTAFFNYTSNGNGIEVKSTWMNTGNGWSRNTAYDMPDVFAQYRGIYSIPRGRFVDVNGDGLMDWMTSYQASLQDPIRKLWLNSGTGWKPQEPANSPYILPEIMYDNINGWDNISPVARGRFMDVNGDGLADWVASYQRPASGGAQEKFVRLNTGRGWTARNAGFQAPPFLHVNFAYSSFARSWPVNQGGEYMDINQDGLIDYVESFKSSATNFPVSKKAYLNTGTGWVAQPNNSPYTPTRLYYDYSGRANAKANFGRFVDINSDGAPDWVEARKGVTRNTRLMRSARADQIKKVTTTMGVTIEPSFLPLTDNDALYVRQPKTFEGQAVQPEPDGRFVRGPSYVTSSVTLPTPVDGTLSVTNYQYEGLQVSRKNGPLGFHNITTVDSLTGIASYRESFQAFPYTGLTKRTATLKDGRLFSWATSHYTHVVTPRLEGTSTYFPRLHDSSSQQFEFYAPNVGESLYRTTNVDNLLYDAFGNVTRQRTRVYNGGGALLHTTNLVNNFKPENTAQWLISQVDSVTQTNSTVGQPSVVNETKYTYYNTTKNGVELGRLHKIIREPNSNDSSIRSVSEYAYDVFGNVVSEKTYPTSDTTNFTPSDVALIRQDTVTYDDDDRLPRTITNALLHTETVDYDTHCDLPITETDANGLVTRNTYDEFCRVKTETSPIGLVSTIDYTDRSGIVGLGGLGGICADCQSDSEFVIVTTAPGEPSVTQVYNKFNQVMSTSTLGVANQPIIQLTYYDDQGRTVSASQPFFQGDSQYWTNYEYDVIGRVIKTELPYNNDSGTRASFTYEYTFDFTSGLSERIVRDTKGRVTRGRVNALGQIAQVVDANSNTMSYFYNSQNNLNRTRDVLGNEITLNYDVLGRRTTLNDPDLGASNYTYNVWGDLVSQSDAKNQTITMEYDKLSRLVKRIVPGAAALSGGESTWVYDQAAWGTNSAGANGLIGAVSSVTGPNGYTQNFSYDEFGRPISQQTTIKGITFDERYAYNSDGFISKRYYPNSGVGSANEFGVKYDYTNGYLTSILSTENAQGQCIEHWRADNYDALGRVDQETLGKLVQTQKTYKPGQNVLERIRSVTTIASNEVVQDLSYQYDSMNNVTSRNDLLGVTGLETFDYDALDRLRFHHKGADTVEVRYDAIGNITYKSDVGAYSYAPNTNGQNSHRLNAVTGGVETGISLDKFQVNWDFDGENFIRSLPSTNNLSFSYDGNGSVVESGERKISWTAFDKPERMLSTDNTQGEATGAIYEYGPEQQRIYKKQAKFNTLSQVIDHGEETIYLGDYYERVTSVDAQGNATGVTHRYTIETGGHTIQIERADGSNFDKPAYLLADNLGSTNVILNNYGEVEQRLAFDPWGMRLNVGDNSSVNSVTNRGYTGHEMDDDTGLINMNARVYDPYLGRFLSADPVLPDPYDMQSFNRYAYVLNNPLKYIDPTGNTNTTVEEYREVYSGPGFYFEFNLTTVTIGDPSSGIDPIVTIEGTAISGVSVGIGSTVVFYGDGRIGVHTVVEFTAFLIVNILQTIDYRPRGGDGDGSSDDGASDGPTGVDTSNIIAGHENPPPFSQRYENEIELGKDILRGLGREVTEPFKDLFEGRVLAAACGFFKVCRGFGKIGELAHKGFKKFKKFRRRQKAKKSGKKGLKGEEAVSDEIGLPRNVGEGRVTIPGTGKGGFRVPDFDPAKTIRTRGTVVEVKNLDASKTISISDQIRDLVKFAEKKGVPLEIFTNAKEPTKGALKTLIDQGKVILTPIK